MNNINKVLSFWFEQLDKTQWFSKDIELDTLIKHQFKELHESASKGELFDWRETAKGRLAEIIILDQFSRNMFRDTPKSFLFDPLALILAQEAISLGADADLNKVERNFLYMPFMHSESLIIHQVSVGLFKQNGVQDGLDFEIKHKEIIERFGRYPHRNSILDRKSTSAEIDFLKQADSDF